MSLNWGHNDLAHDLAENLRQNTDRFVWEDMQLGPSGSPRPDVYALPKIYTRFVPVAYEVKVSVADFRRDVTAGKWMSYLNYAAGVVFAVPKGLITKNDIPDGCGLMVRGDDGWRMVKGPRLTNSLGNLPKDAWMKLLLDGMRRQVERSLVEQRNSNSWRTEDKLRKAHGDEIASLVSRAIRARLVLEQSVAEMEKLAERNKAASREMSLSAKERINEDYSSLAEALGLPINATVNELSKAIYEARSRLVGSNEIDSLRRTMRRIEQALNDGLKPLPGE